MRQATTTSDVATESSDFTLEAGCVVCGGTLAIRIRPGTIRGYCARCNWISKPMLWQMGSTVSVFHPPLGLA